MDLEMLNFLQFFCNSLQETWLNESDNAIYIIWEANLLNRQSKCHYYLFKQGDYDVWMGESSVSLKLEFSSVQKYNSVKWRNNDTRIEALYAFCKSQLKLQF